MTELNGIVLSRLPVLPLRGLTAFPNMIVHFDVGRMMSIRALEAAMKNGQTIFLTAQRELKIRIRRRRATCTRSARSARFARFCVCRAIISACWSRARPVHSRTTLSPPRRTRTACMPRLRKLEDYVYGVTERRSAGTSSSAHTGNRSASVSTRSMRPACRRCGADRSRGRRSGLIWRTILPRIFRSMWQPSRKSSKSLALPAVW